VGHPQGYLEIWNHRTQESGSTASSSPSILHAAPHTLLCRSVQAVIKSYLQLYAPNTPRWDNITSLASALGWQDIISQTTASYFQTEGVSDKYIYELIEAATRVNYGQNADAIHAIEGTVSLAADNAAAVKGGNFQIFEKFLDYANATRYLNTTVSLISSMHLAQ
jgi:prenylcysteine oxidase / farnesylcysteine lyase